MLWYPEYSSGVSIDWAWFFLRIFRAIAVVMALMAFLSQSVGAAIFLPMPCDMGGSSSGSMALADMAAMDHSAHFSGADGAAELSAKNTSDCCDSGGDCAMGSCVSVSIFQQSAYLSPGRFVSSKPGSHVVSVTPPFLLSPYRPPITR